MIVIGNGESRQDFDLSNIKTKTIGCNAIVRDIAVDHLICVDRRMVRECLECHSSKYKRLYTRKEWLLQFKHANLTSVPELPYVGRERADDPFQWGSGPYAILLGAMLCNNIKLIGFDLYSSNGKLNNVYKNTDNYETSDKRAIDPRFWIYQISKIFEYFPGTCFTIYQYNDWKMPSHWKQSNVKLDKISNFTYN